EQRAAVLECLARLVPRVGAALDQGEHRLGKPAAAAPEGALLLRAVRSKRGEVEHDIVRERTRAGRRAATTIGHQTHGQRSFRSTTSTRAGRGDSLRE